jgi:hypothetical protein
MRGMTMRIPRALGSAGVVLEDVRQLDGERLLLGEERTNRRQRGDADACAARDQHGSSARVVDGHVGVRQAEDPESSQRLDADASLERRGQDGVHLGHGDAAGDGCAHVEQHSQHQGEHEDEQRADRDADSAQGTPPEASPRRRVRTGRKGACARGHQYACPMPMAIAMG